MQITKSTEITPALARYISLLPDSEKLRIFDELTDEQIKLLMRAMVELLYR